jgi:hypothetical protein
MPSIKDALAEVDRDPFGCFCAGRMTPDKAIELAIY